MAKIRTLKAEFFRHPGVSRGGLVAKTLAAGIICAIADDDGRFKVKTDQMKGEVFTHDRVTVEDVQEALYCLAREDFIRLYHDHGRAFGAVVNWKSHQVVPPSRYIPSVLPAPPNTKGRKRPHTERKQAEDIVSSRAGVGREGKGEERKGRDISPTAHSVDNGALLVLEGQLSVEPFAQVWQAWLGSRERFAEESGRKVGVVQLDDQRRRRINNALACYPVEDVVDAVQGWAFVPHNRGENDRNRPFNDIELLLRDAKRIETFRDAKRAGLRPSLVPTTKSEQLSSSFRQQAAKLREETQ